MQVCDSSTFLHPRGPIRSETRFCSRCVSLSLSLSLWAFSCLTFQAQDSLRTYLALHMQPFIRLLSLRPLKEEGVHIRGYLDAH